MATQLAGTGIKVELAVWEGQSPACVPKRVRRSPWLGSMPDEGGHRYTYLCPHQCGGDRRNHLNQEGTTLFCLGSQRGIAGEVESELHFEQDISRQRSQERACGQGAMKLLLNEAQSDRAEAGEGPGAQCVLGSQGAILGAVRSHGFPYW
jgi:hypothetical protein